MNSEWVGLWFAFPTKSQCLEAERKAIELSGDDDSVLIRRWFRCLVLVGVSKSHLDEIDEQLKSLGLVTESGRLRRPMLKPARLRFLANALHFFTSIIENMAISVIMRKLGSRIARSHRDKEVGRMTSRQDLPENAIVSLSWSADDREAFERFCSATSLTDSERLKAEEDYKLSKHHRGHLLILRRHPGGSRSVEAVAGDSCRFDELYEKVFSLGHGDLELRHVPAGG